MNHNVQFTEDDCDKIDKLYTDVYIGKDLDNLSIVARLHNLEQRAKNQDKTFYAIIILIAGEVLKLFFVHGK